MSWSTELFCNISYNRETFNAKYEVEDKIDELNKLIEVCEKELRDLTLITEPAKYMDKEDTDPYGFITSKFEQNMESLKEYIEERSKLYILLDNWENCHNKDGLAVYPPDSIKYDTAYLCGDFIKSDKYPTNKSLLE